MKHLKVLSTEKPVRAAEVAWVELKDLIGPNTSKASTTGFVGAVTTNLSNEQVGWLTAQVDNWLQK